MNGNNYGAWRDARMEELLRQTKYDVNDLRDVIVILRGEDGCPWDREQDHHSIRKGLIEECYEVVEAIDRDDAELLREELGDLLLQIVFHADIEKDAGRFDLDDVANDECVKMIHRHPHVFADVSAGSSAEVLKNWEAIKSDEKSRKTVTDKLKAVPPMLPALMRATKVGKKASCFDFPEVSDVMDKISEEFVEVSEAIEEGNQAHIEEEIGDLLLSVTSLCRKLGVSAEDALRAATDKFIGRFEQIEMEVLAEGKELSDYSLEELDAKWGKNKKK